MRIITVRTRPGAPTGGLLTAGGQVFRCALGRGGIRALKREGDGATPLGRMRLMWGYYRDERWMSPRSGLSMNRIKANEGWCDAPGDANYNRHVRLPYAASHERLKRDDRLYDCCIVLDYNLCPRKRGNGSAIFLHLAHPDFRATEGCVAVSPRTMAWLLPRLTRRTAMIVVR